ncbi:hypothetical protein [uncultured Anaerococcus sp.]|uniref:hypothetical protein n=1 Tax=uncultured Anaerococcus sp. TaxID=293428 RepID=UPI0025F94311|nr:hypothetical protein [uncultured Anaerococcus sp.]
MDKKLNDKIIELSNGYGSLSAVPIYSIRNLLFNKIHTYDTVAYDNLFSNNVFDYEIYLREIYMNVFDKKINTRYILIDLEFSEENRFGFWEGDILYLLIPVKNILSIFKSENNIRKWIRRGEYHYIFKKIQEYYNMYSTINFIQEMDFYNFEIFMSLPDELEEYNDFSEWWLLRGNLFFVYIKKDIDLIVQNIKKMDFNNSLIYFFEILLDFYKNKDNFNYDLKIAMFFNYEFYNNLNIIIEDIYKDDIIINFLEKSIYNFEYLYKYITISDENIRLADNQIIFKKDSFKGKLKLKCLYDKGLNILEISYNSINDLNKINDLDIEYIISSKESELII